MEKGVWFHESDKSPDVLHPFILYSVDTIADGDFVFNLCG
jgi:hypothetical protein